jgi:predicted transcriptional regulator
MIAAVHVALSSLGKAATAPPMVRKFAVPVRKSIQPDAITCLEDGRTFKSLKRHLRTSHGLTPEQYRQRWGLAWDYPMVAPAYSEARSGIAKAVGLGRKPAAKWKGSR